MGHFSQAGTAPFDFTNPKVERLARLIHEVYQNEARRQASIGEDEVRHPDDYDALAEHTKEYDRALARWILANFEEVALTDDNPDGTTAYHSAGH